MKAFPTIILYLAPLFISTKISCQLYRAAQLFDIENVDNTNSLVLPVFTKIDSLNNPILFPYQYGYSRNVTIDLKKEGSFIKIPHGKIWRLRIESQGALSIGLFLKHYFVPPESQLLLYNDDRSITYGAFSEINNNTDSSLAIADFPGNYVIVEYYEPDNSLFNGQLIIGRLIHAFDNIFETKNYKSASDEYSPGINCPEGDKMQDIKHAVCLITFSNESYGYRCSGSLINNIRNDGTPYYLTAAHCLSTTAEASTVVAWFDYEEKYCDGPAETPKTLSGAEMISTYKSYDFTLLRFINDPPATYHPYFAGWDANDNQKNKGTCIHHANGGPKKISATENKITSYPSAIKWQDNNISEANSHWEITWNIGYTELGSSGSSLFDDHKRVIGQLHGTSENNDHDFFGKLSYSWQKQTDKTQQLKHWLDPDNTGILICNEYVPPIAPEAIFDIPFVNLCINAPVTLYDSSLFGPTEWFWQFSPEGQVEFHNGTTQYSQNPQVSFTQPGEYDIYLTAGNTYGTDTRIGKKIINAGTQITPIITGMQTDTFLCGCLIKDMPVSGTGASEFSFDLIGYADRFDITHVTDTLYLTLKEDMLNEGSFNTQIILNASHGECTEKITRNISVLLVPNDDVAHAIDLKNGSNGIFDNRCASAEENEPFPDDNNCVGSLSWCPETNNGSVPVSNSIWFKFTGPESGVASIHSPGFDNQLAIYGSESPEDILNNRYKLIAANDDSENGIYDASIQYAPVSPGKQYWVQLDGSKSGKTGQAELIFYNNNIEVFPNPTHGPITIKINGPQQKDIQVKIHSIAGQDVYNTVIKSTNTNIVTNLDLQLNRGLYIIRVTADYSILTKKIIIL